jgi:hypothetical protein
LLVFYYAEDYHQQYLAKTPKWILRLQAALACSCLLITPINYFSCALKTFLACGRQLYGHRQSAASDFPDFLGRNISSLNHPAERSVTAVSQDGDWILIATARYPCGQNNRI